MKTFRKILLGLMLAAAIPATVHAVKVHRGASHGIPELPCPPSCGG